MTERCLELLLLPEDSSCLLLDIGCGSGLSGSVVEENGHMWIGLDISPDMLGKLILEMLKQPLPVKLSRDQYKMTMILQFQFVINL